MANPEAHLTYQPPRTMYEIHLPYPLVYLQFHLLLDPIQEGKKKVSGVKKKEGLIRSVNPQRKWSPNKNSSRQSEFTVNSDSVMGKGGKTKGKKKVYLGG